ncbi:unnamed protein product [Meloidogyne enterolobii]|uniref:Uncharacterized protein n=1 Tax=Meloidogyne enterolobii TaxID=390850 RepID=A0ACB0Z522_MELEN
MAATTANNTINLSSNSHHSTSSPSRPLIPTSTSSSRRGISSPPSLLNARLFARFSTSAIYGNHQQNQEQKMAELRAAYASPQNQSPLTNGSLTSTRNGRNGGRPSRASLPMAALTLSNDVVEVAQNGKCNGGVVEPATPTKTGLLLLQHSKGTALSTTSLLPTNTGSRRGSAVANCLPTPSIMELAAAAGLLSLSPSDLVFESSVLGIAYYDFVLSVSEVSGGNNSSNKSTKTKEETKILTTNPSISSDSSSSSSHTLIQRQIGSPKAKICKHGSEPSPSRGFDKSASSIVSSSLFSKNSGKQQQRLGAERKTSSQSARHEKPEPIPQRKCSSPPPTTTILEQETLQRSNNNAYSNCNYRLFLAKLDTHTNVEWFESVVVPGDLLERNLIPVNELSLLTMGILVWRSRLANSRLLCLANGQLGEDSTTALEALKRAAAKYRCNHHVLTIGQRRQSASSTHSSCSSSSFRSSSSSGSNGQSSQQDAGMKLRVLMCQSRSELPELPSQALRDAKFLLAPSSNPLLCLCFPLT